MFGRRSAKKPPVVLGVDVRDDVIHVVELAIAEGAVEIVSHVSEPVIAAGGPLRDAQAATLKTLVDEHGLAGCRAVLSTTAHDVVGAFGERLLSTRGVDMRQWALTQLEGKLKSEVAGAYVAIAAGSRVAGDWIIGYMRRTDRDPRVAMAREAGLVVLAFDAPITAWQRRYGAHFGEGFDGLLDIDGRPTLYLFRQPVGHVHVFGQLRGEALAAAVRSHMAEMRKRDPQLTIERICVHGPGDQETLVADLRRADRAVEFTQVAVETESGVVDPPWAFAAALATWDAPNADGTRVDLLAADRRGFAAFGRSFSRADVVPGVAALAAAAVVAVGAEIGYSSAIVGLGLEDAQVTAQTDVANQRSRRVGLIQDAVGRLRTVDRDRFWLQRSGRIVALRMVDLANAIPASARISRLSHDDHSGWRVSGSSATLSPIAQTQDALAKISPGQNVTMVHEGQTGNAYGFDLTISGGATGDPSPPNGTALLRTVTQRAER